MKLKNKHIILLAFLGIFCIGALPAMRDIMFVLELITKQNPTNVKAYGAVGDGNADDTMAIQAAIDSTDSTGGTIILPVGTYKTTDTIKLREGQRLLGMGACRKSFGTVILPYNTDVPAIQMGEANSNHWMYVGNLSIDMSNSTDTGGNVTHGILLYPGCWRSTIERVMIGNAPADGIHMTAATPIVGSSYWVKYLDVLVENSGRDNVHLDRGDASAITVQTFQYCSFDSAGRYGIYANGVESLLLWNTELANSTDTQLYLDHPGTTTWFGYGIENNTTYAVSINNWYNRNSNTITFKCNISSGGDGRFDPAGSYPLDFDHNGQTFYASSDPVRFRSANTILVGYDTGAGAEPNVSDLCTGDDSGTTARVVHVVTVTGVWDSNAAGYIVFDAADGDFTDEEYIDVTGGDANAFKIEAAQWDNENISAGLGFTLSGVPTCYFYALNNDLYILDDEYLPVCWWEPDTHRYYLDNSIIVGRDSFIYLDDTSTSAGTISGYSSLRSSTDKVLIYEDSSGTESIFEKTITVDVSSAEIKALHGTPITLVAAPGSGKLLEFVSAVLILDKGTAYDDAASDGNLVIRYTDGSGVIVSAEIEADTFIDSAADAVTRAIPVNNAIVAAAATGCVNQALVLHNNGNEFTTGTGVLQVNITYRLHTSLGL